MKTLEEADREADARWRQMTERRGNGIACPECGAELTEDPCAPVLTSNPPRIMVGCSACDYHGSRVL